MFCASKWARERERENEILRFNPSESYLSLLAVVLDSPPVAPGGRFLREIVSFLVEATGQD